MNLLQKGIIKIVKIYQKYISPDHSIFSKSLNKPPYCKHIPSCSEYMIESVEKKGALKGSLKGIARILRCMPWSKGGYDPVEKKSFGKTSNFFVRKFFSCSLTNKVSLLQKKFSSSNFSFLRNSKIKK